MKIMKNIILLILLLFSKLSYSQKINVLKIGDTIPSIFFKNIYQHPTDSLSLDNYKGRLIIIDFWNKWCGSCIQAFPKMEKFQKDFGDKIKIILVTNNTNQELEILFKKVKIPSLPIIVNDTILNAMFPHTTVPHHVWINPKGLITFITEGYYTSEKNISLLLKGSNLDLPTKREVNDFDKDAPLFKEGNGRLQKYITNYSIGMKRIEENEATKWSFKKDSINHTRGFTFLNTPLIDLYKMAFGNSIYNTRYYLNNRVIYNLPEGNLNFKRPSSSDSLYEWSQKNLVCYESNWNLSNDSLAFVYLQEDLNRFFSYSVKTENKKVACYVLYPKVNMTKKSIKDNETINVYNDSTYRLKNMPLSELLETLNSLNIFETTPVISEAIKTVKIDIHLENAFENITKLKNELLKNGFELKEEERKINVLIISNK